MVEFLFNKFQAHNFIKRKQVFSCEYCKIFKNTFFLQNNSGGFFCIVQLIVLCNLGPSRPKQNCVGYFPSKSLLCTQGQYCTILHKLSCTMSQTYLGNKIWLGGGGLKSKHGGAWGELKMLSKNTCEGVHLIVKL